MIRVGIAGIGFMGMIHYLAYKKVRGIEVAAICTRDDKKRAGDWRSIKGNFGPPGEQMNLAKIAAYRELDELLADPKIDLVDLCLPPYLHAEATIAAFKAGKHVFCEKPMALSPGDCKKMVAAAEKAGKQLIVGHVLPFVPEYAFALQAIRGGKYGKLLGGTFKRLISDPMWIPDFFDPTKVGGPMIDLHVHDAHFIRVIAGMPKGVVSQGRMRGEVVEYFNSLYSFDDPSLVISAASGALPQQGRSFTHGFEIHLEKATLLYDLAYIDGQARHAPLTVIPNKGKAFQPKLADGDPTAAFVGEIKELAQAIGSGKPSALLSGDLARDAIVLCQKQTESVRSGKPVRV